MNNMARYKKTTTQTGRLGCTYVAVDEMVLEAYREGIFLSATQLGASELGGWFGVGSDACLGLLWIFWNARFDDPPMDV